MTDWLNRLRAFAGTPMARRLVYGLFVVQAIVLVFGKIIGSEG